METATREAAAKGEQAAETKSKRGLFEPLALVLLSLATVGTAWCSFEAAVWGGASQRLSNLSAASARTAAASQLQYQQLAVLDVLLFSQYMNARSMSNNSLAQFYAQRFRGEAKTAFESWMATDPFFNTNAPAHPFVTNFYQPRLLKEAKSADADSQLQWRQAGEAGGVSRNYILITVLLASALFCAGTASRFEATWIRGAVLLLGLVAFAIAAGRLVLLPVQP